MANILTSDPARDAATVTPSDTTHLGNVRGVFVGGAGNMRVEMTGGTVLTFTGVAAGSVLPIQVVRIYLTSTTATDMVALY